MIAHLIFVPKQIIFRNLQVFTRIHQILVLAQIYMYVYIVLAAKVVFFACLHMIPAGPCNFHSKQSGFTRWNKLAAWLSY